MRMISTSTTPVSSRLSCFGLVFVLFGLKLLLTPPAVDYHSQEVRREDSCHHLCTAQQVHLAQATNVNEDNKVSMTLTFSLPASCGACSPRVEFGTWVRSSGSVVSPDPVSFDYSSSKSNGIFKSSLIYHTVILDLEAGEVKTWYRIQVLRSSDSSSTQRKLCYASEEKSYFLTPPTPGSPTTVAFVGDLGQTNHSATTLHHLQRAASSPNNPISHLIIAGDMSYADSDPYRWLSWFDMLEPLAKHIPVHVAAGNHEIECDNRTNQVFLQYENYFRNPNRLSEAEILPVSESYRETLWKGECSTTSDFLGHYLYGNSFYSYNHGLLHITVLNSYTYSGEGSPQYRWLVEDLKGIDREVTPWVVVVFHAPLYTTFLGHVGEIESISMKKAMEPIFAKYGVNLVISGHDHAYMRTHPLFRGRRTQGAPVYLILGTGGNRENHSPGFINEVQEDWVASRSLKDYGYGHLHVPNATHAYFGWVRDGFSIDGVQDRAWFENSHFHTV